MKKLLIVLLSVIAISCASTSENSYTKDLAIQYATLKMIESSPDAPEKAKRIVEITNEVLLVVEEGLVVDLDSLEKVVIDRINWADLEPADVLLANTLISVVKGELEQRLGDTTISTERLVYVKDLLISINGIAYKLQGE